METTTENMTLVLILKFQAEADDYWAKVAQFGESHPKAALTYAKWAERRERAVEYLTRRHNGE